MTVCLFGCTSVRLPVCLPRVSLHDRISPLKRPKAIDVRTATDIRYNKCLTYAYTHQAARADDSQLLGCPVRRTTLLKAGTSYQVRTQTQPLRFGIHCIQPVVSNAFATNHFGSYDPPVPDHLSFLKWTYHACFERMRQEPKLKVAG